MLRIDRKKKREHTWVKPRKTRLFHQPKERGPPLLEKEKRQA
jgi:hypothetical protein